MMQDLTLSDDVADRTAATSRHFAHAPAAVFAAIKDPAWLGRWWGPAGFSSRFEFCDFRVGGVWRFTLIGPDGTEYPNGNRFAAIEPDRRVVVEHLSDTHHFFLTITLTPAADGSTELGWRQRFDDVAHYEQVKPFVLPANEQNLDRLAAELERG